MNSLLCFNPVIVESAAASGLIPKIAPVAQSRFKIERWMCGIKREISAVGHRQCTLRSKPRKRIICNSTSEEADTEAAEERTNERFIRDPGSAKS